MQLYARWSKNPYNITYTLNEWIAWTNAPTTANYDESLTIDNPSRTWYTFQWWKITWMDDVTHTYGNTTTTATTLEGIKATSFMNLHSVSWATVSFEAKWEANTYNISYDLSGWSYWTSHPNSASYDQTITIDNPSRTWYTFQWWKITWMDGVTHTYWSNTSNVTTLSNITETTFKNLRSDSTTSVVFTALWSAKTDIGYEVYHYIIDIDEDNGSLEDTYSLYSSWTYYGTSDVYLQISALTSSIAWFRYDRASLELWNGNTPWEDTIDEAKIEPNWSTKIYIFYQRNQYRFTLGSAVGVTTNWSTATKDVYYGTKITLQATPQVCYTWSRWNIEGGTNILTTGWSFTMPANAVTATPVVTENTYTITYNGNGATSWTMTSDSNLSCTATITLKKNTYSRTWYTFKGWAESSDGEKIYDDEEPSLTRVLTGNGAEKILYAVWSPKSYTISYDFNDGEHWSAETITTEYDSWVTIVNPTREWYTFAWWTISWMDTEEHEIWWESITGSSLTWVMATTFMNLTAINWATVYFVAQWTPNPDTKFMVYHYIKDVGAATVTLYTWYELSWETASTIELSDYQIALEWRPYTWWTTVVYSELPSSFTETTTIAADGSTKIYLYYIRNKYKVQIDHDAYTEVLALEKEEYEYWERVTVKATPQDWYHFLWWRSERELREEDEEEEESSWSGNSEGS